MRMVLSQLKIMVVVLLVRFIRSFGTGVVMTKIGAGGRV
jgi:hypothetical protein